MNSFILFILSFLLVLVFLFCSALFMIFLFPSFFCDLLFVFVENIIHFLFMLELIFMYQVSSNSLRFLSLDPFKTLFIFSFHFMLWSSLCFSPHLVFNRNFPFFRYFCIFYQCWCCWHAFVYVFHSLFHSFINQSKNKLSFLCFFDSFLYPIFC